VEPSLLPNQTECQDIIVAFYDLISSPNSENLTNATDLFAEDFSYSQVSYLRPIDFGFLYSQVLSTSCFLNYRVIRHDSSTLCSHPIVTGLLLRVVHLGRSTCHAISGRGISQLGFRTVRASVVLSAACCTPPPGVDTLRVNSGAQTVAFRLASGSSHPAIGQHAFSTVT